MNNKDSGQTAVCSFCGFFIVFVRLSLWCPGLDVDLIVSVPEFSYLLHEHVEVKNHSTSIWLHNYWIVGECSQVRMDKWRL